MYPLQAMLKIRAMREDRAGTELTSARRARDAAEEVRDEKSDARKKFEQTKDERRDRVYAAVIGKTVSMDMLDQARDAVTRIDEEGLLLQEAELKAIREFEQREQEADSAKIRFITASRNKMKIDQHKLIWAEEERKRQEYAADAEMDEFTGRRMSADDDDSFD